MHHSTRRSTAGMQTMPATYARVAAFWGRHAPRTMLPHPPREAGLDGWKPPAAVQVRGSLPGYWRAARGLFSRGRTPNELALLHVPQEGVTALRAMAAGERVLGGLRRVETVIVVQGGACKPHECTRVLPGNQLRGKPQHRSGVSAPRFRRTVGNAQVTTGDAMQAAAALLIHAAHHRPLLPVAPLAMAVMVLLPTPKDFFGNAVRMLSVSLPPGTQQPAEHDAPGALRALAGGIREATLRFRSEKVRAWQG